MGKLSDPANLLRKVAMEAGAYYLPPDLFYQRLWRQRLQQIGFGVISVERLPHHPVWDIRLRGNLATQLHLLLSKPMASARSKEQNLLLRQIRTEIQQIAKQLGNPIRSDCLTIERKGTYVRLAFVWPLGKPGILRRKDKKPEPLSFLIKPWLRRIRN